ncbi:MAG: nickel-dependent lactate racemase [Solobacterium sp.]|nr:nickel-dependent lactate racemase [Solobacterium sp.]
MLSLPYGEKRLEFEIPKGHPVTVLQGKLESYVPPLSEEELVLAAMNAPIGSKKLSELAQGRRKVVLLCSDHTRPVPSRLIVPHMLREIREGAPDADITILIATGCHRLTTTTELEAKFGTEIYRNEKIVIHDCEDEANLVRIGTLPSGGDLIINRLVVEADLVCAEGFIEPHFFAGFSGGRKSILPGVAARVCVHYNHNAEFIDDPHARMGILDGNPIHRDMIFAAREAKLAYIVNVVLNADKKVVAAYAGDADAAHLAGCAFVKEQMGCRAVPGDIVITTNNGYPLDQNVYQMVKGMCTAEATCAEGSVIIAAGECRDGIGGDGFYKTFKECTDISALLKEFRAMPKEETILDQWQSQIFARILENHKVIFVSGVDDDIVRDFHMIPARSMPEALAIAEGLIGKKDYSVTVLPEGISVIPLGE